MKQIVLIIWFLNLSSTLSFINAQILTGEVFYKQTSISDTTSTYEVAKDGVLIFDISGGKSVYITDRKLTNEEIKHTYETQNDGSMVVKTTGKNGDKVGRIIYKSHQTKELICRDGFNAKPFVIQDEYPSIKWSILDSVKSIKGINCQKAEGDFRGRHYIAWFTNKIPIPDGPWKLCGLPGLILEAYDEKKHFKFLCEGIEFPRSISEKINPPTGGEEIKFLAFHKLLKNTYEDLPKKMKALNEQFGITVLSEKYSFNLIERNINEE